MKKTPSTDTVKHKPATKPTVKKLTAKVRKQRQAVLTSRPAYVYLIFSLLVVFGSTLFWSITSAHLQNQNADQLVDPLLFSDASTFHGAVFPSTHSFLLKWPLFWLVSLFGTSMAALTFVTVAVSLLTVGLLILILSRIERRPMVLGTICLGLASVLMLVPAVPVAGTLLPVNFAMLTTRNLEYIVYIGILLLLVRAKHLRSRPAVIAVVLFSLLAATDRLFLYIGLVGSLMALAVSALRANNVLTLRAVQWLVVSIGAAVGMLVILSLIKLTGLTGFSESSAQPYGLTGSFKQLVLGLMYGVLGVFTNFGANPAFDATELHALGSTALSRMWSLSGISYLVNATLVVLLGYLAGRLFIDAFRRTKRRDTLSQAETMAVYLTWSVIAAFGLFIGTGHYYAVDARYLTPVLFLGAVVGAVYARTRVWQPKVLAICGAVFTVTTVLAIPSVQHDSLAHQAALTPVDFRNQKIVEVLKGHPVDHLLGDYWRVLPISQAADARSITPIPMASCDQLLTTLTSTAWQKDWPKHGFAYLLSLEPGLTGYPACSLDKVTAAYGKPNASVLISGTYQNPKEFLLFYDGGRRTPEPKNAAPQSSTVTPIALDELTDTVCTGPTVVTIVAHEDDDLLFTNPDLIRSINKGYCVRTVFLTAGDAGAGRSYWLGREQGAQAAYDHMDGPGMDIWVQRTVRLNDHAYFTVSMPRGNPKLALVFLHLPDGGLQGQGFASTGNQSIAKLVDGNVSSISTVDGQSSYSKPELIEALTAIMQAYRPTEIRTQAPRDVGTQYNDHSDHVAVGSLVTSAYQRYEEVQYANEVTIPLKYYVGYPVREQSGNVSGDELHQKLDAFLSYAGYDGAVCRDRDDCLATGTYGSYLTRQYQTQP
ncbi:MAG: hypothetical protein JWM37_691 [Candidatus Saccharibacteria bacterium]|nr:hypothetical protein [Candidatus Saccharibacteria bacterium]